MSGCCGLFDLTGRRVLVVGAATGGLGAYAAQALASQGADTIVADLPERAEDLAHTVEALRTTNDSARAAHCDITSEDSVAALIETAVAPEGRLDVLVNTAAVMLRKDAAATSLTEWQRIVDVNLTGAWLLNRAAGTVMARHGHGRIVNFSTVYAERVGPAPESAYYASKAGVANLTRAMASELGPAGVTVNCLAPGVFYPTNMTDPLNDQPDRLTWMTERTLLGRLGTPDSDLDGPLLLLASDASSYMTGQVLYVDGGWSAW